jgi:hypothetical protein
MLVFDVVNSCSHRHVAAAAVLSIGGEFAETVRRRADGQGVSVGDFTADRVRRFSRGASERDWRFMQAGMDGQDFALLSGLRILMTRMMQDEADRASQPERMA